MWSEIIGIYPNYWFVRFDDGHGDYFEERWLRKVDDE